MRRVFMGIILAGLLFGPFCPMAHAQACCDPTDDGAIGQSMIQTGQQAAPMTCCVYVSDQAPAVEQVQSGLHTLPVCCAAAYPPHDLWLVKDFAASDRGWTAATGYRDKFETKNSSKRE